MKRRFISRSAVRDYVRQNRLQISAEAVRTLSEHVDDYVAMLIDSAMKIASTRNARRILTHDIMLAIDFKR